MAHPCFSLWCAIVLLSGKYTRQGAGSLKAFQPAFPDVSLQRMLEQSDTNQALVARSSQGYRTEKIPTQLELATQRSLIADLESQAVAAVRGSLESSQGSGTNEKRSLSKKTKKHRNGKKRSDGKKHNHKGKKHDHEKKHDHQKKHKARKLLNRAEP